MALICFALHTFSVVAMAILQETFWAKGAGHGSKKKKKKKKKKRSLSLIGRIYIIIIQNASSLGEDSNRERNKKIRIRQ